MFKLFAIRAKMLSWENRRETFVLFLIFIKSKIIYLYLYNNELNWQYFKKAK